MNSSTLRRLLLLAMVLLVPVAWLSMGFDPYAIDGDAVAYMDIADLLRTHQWPGVVNAYWHPLYPATLLLGQWLFRPTRFTELDAYYKINFGIFLLQAVAVIAFTSALARLRDRMAQAHRSGNLRLTAAPAPALYLLSADALRLLGLALLVIASQRELTLGKVRPDGLLQALLLFAFSATLELCTCAVPQPELPTKSETETSSEPLTEPLPAAQLEPGRAPLQNAMANSTLPPARVHLSTASTYPWAALMGLGFGLAYLTKSFAFPVALLAIVAVTAFQYLCLKRSAIHTFFNGLTAFIVFAAVAGPYVAALSHQKHRLDFGDSGSLNYAWYVAGTEKFHLEPWQSQRFGSADVHLIHPERQLLAAPGIYSYKAQPYGTNPPWFDASFFNERIVNHIRVGQLARRDVRNLVLILRYLLNHPEAWVLFALLLFLGAHLRPAIARNKFWLLPVALGSLVWGLYALVNVEERYVTFGYLMIVLPLFATLQSHSVVPPHRSPNNIASAAHTPGEPGVLCLSDIATFAVVLLAFLSLGESIRLAAENRRQESLHGISHGWHDPTIFAAAKALQRMGVRPGDEVACIGNVACVYDPYWMRLTGVRTTTEIFMDHDHVAESLSALSNREEAFQTVRHEGAKVLVGHFDASRLAAAGATANGWQRLDDTGYFAFPLNLSGRPGGNE